MLKKTILMITFLLFIAGKNFNLACDEGTATLVSETDNGNGTFTYVITMCSEMLGLEGIPDEFRFTFSGGTVSGIISCLPNTVSTSSGDQFTQQINGLAAIYTLQSVWPAHNSNLMCNNFTITTTGRPTNIACNPNSDYSPNCNRNIAIPAVPPCVVTAAISGSTSICSGDSPTISVALTGTAPYSFTYSNGSTNQSVTGVNSSPYTFNVSPTTTTTYTLVSVNNATCNGTVSGSTVITVTPSSAPVYTSSSTDVTCAGANTGSITLNPTGNLTYDWVSGPITSPIPAGNLPGGASDERALINLPTGTYCVDITSPTSPGGTVTSTLFSDNFESGAGNWTLNTGTGTNMWIANNVYAGEDCFSSTTGTFLGATPDVPNQNAGVTGNVNSNYLHVYSTTSQGCSAPFPGFNANYQANQAANQVATLNTVINTTGYSNVTFSFYWTCNGMAADYAVLEYSIANGAWTQVGSNLFNQGNWNTTTLTNAAWNNVANLRFRFRWINNASGSDDHPFSVDQIVITGDQITVSSCGQTVQECFSIDPPASITPTFTALAPVCQNAAAPSLPANSTNGIAGSWSPAVSTATSGNQTYTFTPTAGQCGTTTTLTLLVNPILTPSITCGASTTSSVQFNWTTLTGATNYAITYTVNGGGSTNANTASPTFTVNGLSPNDVVDITITPTGTGCYQAGTGSCTALDCTPPVITVQPPADQTLCEGLATNFNVTVTGAVSFQWQISTNNGTTFSNLSNGGVYSGVTTNNLSISDVTGLNGNIYRLQISGNDPNCPAITDPAITLTVNDKVDPTFSAINDLCVGAVAPLLPGSSTNAINGTWVPATISTAAANSSLYTFTADAGQCSNNASMTVNVIGNISPIIVCGTSTTTSVSFDWQNISGATSYDITYTINGGSPTNDNSTNSIFTVSGLSPNDVVAISVLPLGAGCFASSNGSCTALSCTSPTINLQAIDQIICENVPVEFVVTASNGVSYQWQVSTDGGLTFSNIQNDGTYFGTDFTTLSISNTTGLSGNLYQLIVNEVNNTCPIVSNPALLTVNPTLVPTVSCGSSTSSSVTFNWSSLAGASDYDLSYSINGNTPIEVLDNLTNSYTVSGLNPNDQVEISISADGVGCFADATGSCSAIDCAAPTITSQPQDDTSCEGSAVSLSITETGGSGYQWQVSVDGGATFTDVVNVGVFSGATTTNLSITDNTGLNGLQFRVVVSEVNGTCPTTSNVVTLTVDAFLTPSISCGTSTINSVEFTWSNLAGATSYDISYTINGGGVINDPGFVGTSYTVNGLSANDVVDITVTPNGTGCYNSSTGSCTATNCTSPTVTTQPQDDTSCEGSAVSLSITETGGSGYQWQVSVDGGATFTDVVNVGVFSGATTTNLSITDNTGLNGLQFRVVVSEVNGTCPTTSNVVTLTVDAFLTPSISCGTSTINSVEFTWSNLAGATSYDISYTINGGGVINDPGFVGTSYTVNGLSANDVVDITVTPNGTGCYNSSTGSCTATNCTSPTITTQPQDDTSCEGSAVSLSITETGGSDYQWQVSVDGGATFTDVVNVGVFSGATTTNLSITDNTGLNGLQFRVVVSEANGTCPTTSNVVTLTVDAFLTPSISCGTSTINSVEFTWSNLAGATSYDISYTINGGGVINDPGFVGTSYTVNGLSANDVVEITITPNGTGCYDLSTQTCAASNCVGPVISVHPQNNTSCEGTAVTLNLTSAGGTSFQWQVSADGGITFTNVLNVGVFSGATTTNLSISNNTGLDGMLFRVVVNDATGNCPSTSLNALLTVNQSIIPIISPSGPFCESNEDVTLTVNTAGGTWSGSGISDPILGTFQPSNASIGNNVISYTTGGSCPTTGTIVIIVNPIPTANFIISNGEISAENPKIEIGNYSLDATSYIWDFGDNTSSTEINPIHTYPLEASNYTIKLLAMNSSGCYDSMFLRVSVPGILIYYVPNSFTPNGDEHNNVFKPIFTEGYDPKQYHLTIYDRWGERIFESYDSNVGWDGTFGDIGLVKNDTYTWKITFSHSFDAESETIVGHVNLLK